MKIGMTNSSIDKSLIEMKLHKYKNNFIFNCEEPSIVFPDGNSIINNYVYYFKFESKNEIEQLIDMLEHYKKGYEKYYE